MAKQMMPDPPARNSADAGDRVGRGIARVSFRNRPESFRVEELPERPPSGEGSFLWVRVEKRNCNTNDVAKDLARAAGVSPGEVSWAGRKDRVSLARQWFSLPGGPDVERRLAAFDVPDVTLLEVGRHFQALRPGDLCGNRFGIDVELTQENETKESVDSVLARTSTRARELERRGFENRFGVQRFGTRGDNPSRALGLLRGAVRVDDRRRRSFLLNALQAAVFNRVLEIRRAAGVPIDRVRRGDLVYEHRSGGVRTVAIDEDLSEEAAAFLVSATGPMLGVKMRRPRGDAAKEEEQAMAEFGLPELDRKRLPRGVRLPGTRRPVRARVRDVSVHATEGETEGESSERAPTLLTLDFTLERGSYATVLLAELFPGARLVDEARSRANGAT